MAWLPLPDIQRVVCNVVIFRGMAELLWAVSTKGKVLGYSLIINWRSRDGVVAGEALLFPQEAFGV